MAQRHEHVDVNLNGNRLLCGSLQLNGSNVSPIASFTNKVIGGNFDTNPWQRGTSLSTTTSGYLADSWITTTTVARSMQIQRSLDAPTVAQAGFLVQNSLQYSYLGTPATLVAGDATGIRHAIEGRNFRAIAQQPFTVSFWVKSSKTGIYSLSARNSGSSDRSCVIEYVINAANTWEYKSVTFPASPIAGTWDYTNGVGLFLTWQLGTGSTFTTSTLNTWITGNFVASPNSANWLDSQNASFRLALVQCEVGSIATSFEQRSVGHELQLCQRYYCQMHLSDRFPASAANQFATHTVAFPVWMRATPTATLLTGSQRLNLSSVAVGATSPGYARFEIVSAAAGDAYALFDHWAFSADI